MFWIYLSEQTVNVMVVFPSKWYIWTEKYTNTMTAIIIYYSWRTFAFRWETWGLVLWSHSVWSFIGQVHWRTARTCFIYPQCLRLFVVKEVVPQMLSTLTT